MIEQKGHDWILNILSNPTFSTADFKNAGLDASNTSLLKEQDYLKSQKILENPQFAGEDQKFDKNKFHNFYQGASNMYSMLANETYLDELEKEQVIYGKDDIFAPKEQRRTFADTVQYSRSHNPNRQTTGLIRVGETANPKFSDEEIAQTQKVLVNPVEADKDPSKAIWHDAPNDSWFTDFWDTRVLAQWEDEGTHIDPITGEEVTHQKGELKLNDNGTYYYENLDGRDVYGKRVLNKMNTLTTDGSKWNKYDFFDSDDLTQKSIGGTVMKNLALVGTMFVPYVGPVVAGLSVASQLVGLTGTLGKMLLGSDSPTFSALEGWSKSVNRQTAKSIYAQQNTWCWENFISLIGDVAGQLKEQRFLFNYAPAIIKGNKVLGANGISQSKQAKLVEEAANKYRQQYTSTLEQLNQAGKTNATTFRQFQDAMTSAKIVGQNEVEDFMKSYYKIGEILSKGYMTAITVGDTYGEAKYEGGASDIEATLLTLGYGAAELALLNSNIGEWILPELKNSGLKNKKIIEALKTSIPEEMREQAIDTSSRAAKENFVKFWFNKGKELAKDVNIAGKGLIGQGISGGLGEGFEEVSEELLADVSKSCYNVVQWMQGDNNRMSAWDNMIDRYGMSFIGGALGGGLTAIGTNFNTYNKDLTTEQAMQELVYMSREGKLDEIYKTLDKVTIGNKYLQGELDQQDGELKLKPATSTSSNLDKDIKNAIRQQIQIIDDIVKTEGLKVTDNQFISAQTFNDIKLSYLAQSPVTSSYLQDFNTLCTKIINIKNQMNQLKSTDAKLTDEQQQVYDNLNSELNDLREQKDKYINGEYAMDYIGKSLLSMSPVFSKFFTKAFFKDYVETKEKKKFDQVSDSRLKDLKTEFDNWKATDFKDCISVMSPLYLNLAKNFGQYATDFAENYNQNRNNTSLLRLTKNLLQKQTATLLTINENNIIQDPDQDAWVEQLQRSLSSTYADTSIALLLSKGNDSIKQTLQSLTQSLAQTMQNTSSPTYEQDLQKAKQNQADFVVNELLNNSQYYFSDIASAGLINPEIKQSIISTINELKKVQENYENIMRSNYKTIQEIEDEFLMYNIPENINQNTKIEDLVNTYGQGIIDTIINIKSLSQLASSLGMEFKTLGDIETINQKLKNRGNELDQTSSKVTNTTYTDTVKFIQDFIQSNSDSNLDINKLLSSVNTLLIENKDNLSSVNLEQFGQQIDEAIEVIGWLQGVTLGAQYDAEATLSNLMGYNQAMNTIAKRHGAKDWEDLFTIDQDTVNIINQDLELIKNKLIQAKNLKYINENKKLSLQDRVATNKKYIEYNRLAKWIVNVDDSWAKKSELQEAIISKAETLKKYAADRKNMTLSQDENLKAEQETLAIDKAIYSFFEANSDKINNGELKNLFKKDFDFWDPTTQILNESTEYLSDRNFFWYLASRAAINRGSFLNKFKQILDPKIAPLPTQEEAIFINVSNALNGDRISQFKNAYIQAAQEEYDNSDSKEDIIRKFRPNAEQGLINSLLQDKTVKEWEIIPQYDITLTEGIPGAGKSDAVNYYTIKMLQNIPELANNIVYVHNNVKGAEKAINSLGIRAKASDKNSFMSSIFSAYNTSRSIDSKGNSIYDKNEFITTQDGQLITKYNIDSLTNPPSLLIIDEISHYDQPDLQLIQKLIDNYGTVVITSGDYDQSSKKAIINDFEPGINYTLESYNHQFVSPIKLGISMRSSNVQLDKTLSDYQAWLQLEESKRGPHTFYWYEDSNGINGAKIINQNDSEIIDNVQKMVDTLQEKDGVKQKIGLIYYDENSPVYRLLTSRFGDNIQTFKGNAAQGFEGQYYIIDTNNIPSTFQKDLYTGISRSSQGALIVGNISNINSVQETVTTQKLYTPQELKKYTNKRIELIEKLDTGNTDLGYKPRTLNTNRISPSSNTLPPDIPIFDPPSINWNGPVCIYYLNGVKYYTDGTIVASDNNGTITEIQNTDSIYQQIIDMFNNEDSLQELIQNEETDPLRNSVELNNADNNQDNTEQPIEEDDSDFKFSYLFHSFNTFELGVENDNGKVKWLGPIDRYTYRFDSVIGLLKIFEGNNWYSNHNIQKYIDILGTLRGAMFTIESKSELVSSIEYILREAGVKVESIQFGLVSSPNIKQANRASGQTWGYANNSGKYGALDKSTEEKSINGTVSNEINRKSLNAVIRFQGGKKLAIPLFVLGNLETYTRNPQSAASQRLAQLYARSNGNYHQFIQDVLNDNMLQNIPQIYNLAKLFNFTSAGYFKIDDDTWTPAKNLNNWGIQVNVEANSGGHFPYNGREAFNPIKNFLASNRGMRFTEQIYTSLTHIIDSNGNSINIARKGHPFVLATYDPNLTSDDDMKDRYKRQLADPSLPKTVSLIYIAPPKVEISQYLTNLYNIIKKVKGTKVLGSHLTAYECWKSLVPLLQDNTSWLNSLFTEKVRDYIISKVQEIDNSRDKVNAIMAEDEVQSDQRVSGQAQKQSILKHLNYLLVHTFTDLGGNIISENLQKLTDSLVDAELKEIYYSPKFLNKIKTDQDFIPIIQDAPGTYTIDGLDFTINAKIDSNLFQANKEFNDIVENWVNKIDESGSVPRSFDTNLYVGSSSTNNTPTNEYEFADAFGNTHNFILQNDGTITYNGNKIRSDIQWNSLVRGNVFYNIKQISDYLKSYTGTELQQQAKYIYAKQFQDCLYDNNQTVDELIVDEVFAQVDKLNNTNNINTLHYIVPANNKFGIKVMSQMFNSNQLSSLGINLTGVIDRSLLQEIFNQYNNRQTLHIQLSRTHTLQIDTTTNKAKIVQEGSSGISETPGYVTGSNRIEGESFDDISAGTSGDMAIYNELNRVSQTVAETYSNLIYGTSLIALKGNANLLSELDQIKDSSTLINDLYKYLNTQNVDSNSIENKNLEGENQYKKGDFKINGIDFDNIMFNSEQFNTLYNAIKEKSSEAADVFKNELSEIAEYGGSVADLKGIHELLNQLEQIKDENDLLSDLYEYLKEDNNSCPKQIGSAPF